MTDTNDAERDHGDGATPEGHSEAGQSADSPSSNGCAAPAQPNPAWSAPPSGAPNPTSPRAETSGYDVPNTEHSGGYGGYYAPSQPFTQQGSPFAQPGQPFTPPPQQGSHFPPQGQPYAAPPAPGQPFAPPQGIYPYPPLPQQPWNALCIVGFIMAFLFPPAGLVLSIIALVQINSRMERSRGLSIAGIVIGAFNTIAIMLMIGLLVWAIGSMELYDDETCFDGVCSDYSDMDDGTFARGDPFASIPFHGDTQKYASGLRAGCM